MTGIAPAASARLFVAGAETIMTDNDDFDDVDDDFDLDTLPPPQPRLPARNTAAALLPIALIEHNVPRRDIRRLAGARSMCLVIQAPAADWVAPLADAVRQFASWDFIHARSAVDRLKSPPDVSLQQAVQHLAEGRRIVGISQYPDRILPTAMVRAADALLQLPPPSDAVIASVIRQITGRTPRNLPANVGAILGFDDIVACIRRNSTARECADRLARAMAGRSSSGPSVDAVPDLSSLYGYGAAMTWAQNLVVDLEAWRRGAIPFSDIEAHCVLASDPGLGKTSLMRSLAKAAGIPLIATSVGAWFANSPGNLDSVIKQIDEVFASARAVAPAIVFLDEIDAVPNRATLSGRGSDWWLPVITHLLITLDGAVSGAVDNLIVVGATNHPERLDAALVRPGRLSQLIHIDRPDQDALAGILRQHLGSDLDGVDLTEAAALGVGGSGADVAAWVKSARRVARLAGRGMTMADLLAAIAPDDARPAEHRQRVAIHEAGHAVIGHVLGLGSVTSVSTIRQGLLGGQTVVEAVSGLPGRTHLEDRVTYDLAGRAAEQVLLGSISSGSGGDGVSDLASATRTLGTIHLSLGLGDSLIFRATPDDVPRALAMDRAMAAKVDADLQRLYARAVDLVDANRHVIQAVADALLHRRHLDGDQFLAIVNQAVRKRAKPREVTHG